MTSTGTFSYSPAASDLVVAAYSRLGIRAAQITTQHLVDAYTESNLLLVEWSNKQPNLWTEDLQSQAVTAGTSTYPMTQETVALLIVYLTIGSGSSAQDRVMSPISGTDYASYPNKLQTGAPSVFWFNRTIVPSITIWPVPDSTQTYTLKWRRVRQVQDTSIKGGATLDAPYRWLDAFTAGLAHRLARMYAQKFEQLREADAVKAWGIAAYEDQEDVGITIMPDLQGYFA